MEGQEKKQYKKGLWTEDEDRVLLEHIKVHGLGQWNRIPKLTALQRCGKSCRLRWLNYLSPNVKRGCFSEEEEDLIIRLHKLLGNRWSLIAGRVPGRTDNQVKNHWNTHLSKKLGLKMQSRKLVHSSSLKHLQKSVPINSDVSYYKDDQPSNYNISGVAKSMEFEVMQDQNKPNLDNVTEEDDHDLQGGFSERPQESPCTQNSGPEFPWPIYSSDLSDFVSSDHGFWEFIDGYPDYLDHQMWQGF